jgi:hypothetical protein
LQQIENRRKMIRMTTQAGWIGILAGMITGILLVPLTILVLNGNSWAAWGNDLLFILMMTGGGYIASRKSLATRRWRCTILGGLAGALAGSLTFCLWGGVAAGINLASSGADMAYLISQIIRRTEGFFLALFVSGTLLGAMGGWISRIGKQNQEEVFNKVDPQMAMNTTITATAASVVTVIIAAVVFSHLEVLPGLEGGIDRSAVLLPVRASMLLVFISQLALTLVVPHETIQAEHRNGMNEVKMAAYVSIATAPVLLVVMPLIDVNFLSDLLIDLGLAGSAVLSVVSIFILIRKVMPRRNSFPLPPEDWKKTEHSLFGSIAGSVAWRLVELCAGCGIVMVLPVYACVLAVLINVAGVMSGGTPGYSSVIWLKHALASVGVMAAVILFLSAIYIFYLNLGRWFSRRNVK